MIDVVIGGVAVLALLALGWHLVRERDLTKMFALEAALGRAEARILRLEIRDREAPTETQLKIRPRAKGVDLCYDGFETYVRWQDLQSAHNMALQSHGDFVLRVYKSELVALYLPAARVPELRVALARILAAYTASSASRKLHVVKEALSETEEA